MFVVGFFIFAQDSKSGLQIFGLVDGIYNESEVSATFDEGTEPTLLGKPKLIAFPDVICSQTPLRYTVHR